MRARLALGIAALCASCSFDVHGLAAADGGSNDAAVPADLDVAPPDLGPPLDLAPPIFTTLALFAGGTPGYADGIGMMAKFDNPNGITADPVGNLYVADTNNAVVRKIDASAKVTTVAGTQGDNSEMDGFGAQARFDTPEGIAADALGNVWVTDAGAGTIRRIVADAVSTFAGSGSNGFADAIGTAARFNQPRGIIADGLGNLYVSDSSNQVIRKVVIATAAVTTLAGGVGQTGHVDATGTAARFNEPRSLALDGVGNLYVADSANSCIRAVALATGAVTTLAGSGTPGGSDGVGTAAAFDNPRGLASDGLGDLYVADTNNSMIRKIVLATATVTTIAGMAHVVGQQLGPLPGKVDDPWGIVVRPGSGELAYTDVTTGDVLVIR